MASLPETMRGLVARKYGPPSTFEVIDLPVPTMTKPDEVLFKVHAAGATGGDALFAQGSMRLIASIKFPATLCAVAAGIVVAVGGDVTSLRPGDAVYGLHFSHPVVPFTPPGFCAEYAVTRAAMLLPKPAALSFEDAAALVGPTVTAYQCLKLAVALTGATPEEGLRGKTVFMPAALGACGSVGAQMIKHVFGAERLVATVSTPKMPLVEEHIPGVVDQLIDYKTQNVVEEVGAGTVDVVYNTVWDLVGTFPLLKPRTGVAVSIASVPPPKVVRSIFGGAAPRWLLWAAAVVQWYYAWRLRGTDVKLEFVSGNPGVREDYERAGDIIASGKLKAVTTVVDLEDIDEVRRLFTIVASHKGAFGGLIIKIV